MGPATLTLRARDRPGSASPWCTSTSGRPRDVGLLETPHLGVIHRGHPRRLLAEYAYLVAYLAHGCDHHVPQRVTISSSWAIERLRR